MPIVDPHGFRHAVAEAKLAIARGRESEIICGLMYKLSPPTCAKIGQLKGKLVTKVKLASLISVGYTPAGVIQIRVKSPTSAALTAEHWLAEADLARISRATHEVVPFIPFFVEKYLLGAARESLDQAGPALEWLQTFYAELSTLPEVAREASFHADMCALAAVRHLQAEMSKQPAVAA